MDRIQKLASSMRLAGGNLHIKLGADSRYDILVDKDIVKAACPMLEPRLRSPDDPNYAAGFDTSTEITIPSKPNPELRRVYTIGMRYVDQTLVLEKNDFEGVPMGEDYYLFCQSDLAAPGWPKQPDYKATLNSRYFDYHENERAALQYIAIFKILHGIPFALVDLLPWAMRRPWTDIEFYIDFIVELCARAEYLGCLPHVADAFKKVMLKDKTLWTSIARSPVKYLQIAVKLHCEEIYFDSLRHLLAQPDDQVYRELLMDHLNLSTTDFEAYTMRLHFEQAKIIKEMCNELHRLELFEAWSVAYGGGQDFSNRTTYFNKVEFNGKPKGKDAQLAAQIDYLVRSQWSQFLAQQNGGDRIVVQGRRRGRPAGPMSRAVTYIASCTKSKHPEKLFGKKVAEGLVQLMSLPPSSVKVVNDKLAQIVKEADAIIKEKLVPMSIVTDAGKKLTYQSSRVDLAGDHWTYFPVDETHVPWKDDKEWEAAVAPQARIHPIRATDVELDAIGIDHSIHVPTTADVQNEASEHEAKPETTPAGAEAQLDKVDDQGWCV